MTIVTEAGPVAGLAPDLCVLPFANADAEVDCGCVLHYTHGPKCSAKLTGRVELPQPAWLREGIERRRRAELARRAELEDFDHALRVVTGEQAPDLMGALKRPPRRRARKPRTTVRANPPGHWHARVADVIRTLDNELEQLERRARAA